MKGVAFVFIAAMSVVGTAEARAVDVAVRAETYAAQSRQQPIFMVPLFSGRSFYAVDPPFQFRYLGPLRGVRSHR